MSEVKVLVQGYAKKEKTGWRASSTTVLIKDSGLNILVDPGANSKLLLKALAKNKLKTKDVDLIFLTHYHPDHLLNISLFLKIKILDGDIIYQEDKETGFTQKIPGTTIRVIPTPGHAHEHASLLVETKMGKVAIAGDLFWWADQEKQKTDYQSLVKKGDPYVKNKKALIASRQKILKIADYIIPGHGRVFQITNKTALD